MNPQRKKAYLLLIVIAVVALVVDRLVLTDSITTPDVALASMVEPSTAVRPTQPMVVSQRNTIPVLPFPMHLPTIDPETRLVDIFQPVPQRGYLSTQAEKEQLRSTGRSGVVQLKASAFKRQHRLTGVLIYGQVKVAIVDGKWIRINEKISGCHLESMSGNQAHFICHDGPVVLTVENPSQLKGN